MTLILLLVVLLVSLLVLTVDAKSATASHILVKDEKKALEIKQSLDQGADFAAEARVHSSCPSKNKGGSLGTFKPGQMVKEFNDAVFDESNPIGDVIGPVKTQFGYHLIQVTERSD